MLGIGRSLLLQLDKTGELGPKFRRLGNRKILMVKELCLWMAHDCPPRHEWLSIWADIANDMKVETAQFHGPDARLSRDG